MGAASFDWESPNGAGGAPLSSASPQPIGTAAAGSGTAASKDDHVHAHGNQLGGALHANAVASGAAGFLSGTDKAKLDSITTANIPSADEKAALAGTSGTPSGSNKYVTGDDTRLASVALRASFGSSTVITSSQQYIQFEGRHSTSFPLTTSTAALRVWLPEGAVLRLRGGVEGTVSSGSFTLRFSIYAGTTANGALSEDTASRLEFANADGANPAKTGATYTVPSGGRYVTMGAIYVGGASIALASQCQLERVS